MYSLNWLKTFDGNLSPSEIDLALLADTIEANVSQYRYFYNSNINDLPKMIIEVKNDNIPHLLGLNHHIGLPSYPAGLIFEELKKDLTLKS